MNRFHTYPAYITTRYLLVNLAIKLLNSQNLLSLKQCILNDKIIKMQVFLIYFNLPDDFKQNENYELKSKVTVRRC